MTSVDLVSARAGGLTVSVHAEIANNGDLHVTRQDFGPGAAMTAGDEAEKVLAVAAGDKDRLLLALLAAHYGGQIDAQDRIAAFAVDNGVEVSQFRWP